MARDNKRGRISKDQWLTQALELFAREGEPGVRIEQLARELKVAKAGFYWHFKDREDLLRKLLDYWAHEYTEVVTENTILRSLEPRERLLATMQMIYDHNLGELDAHFHVWALKNPAVARHVRVVIRRRLDYLRNLLAELGFEGDGLEARARLFVAYESNEGLMFRHRSKDEARKLRIRRWKLYLGEE